MKKIKLKKIFEDLVEAYENGDDDEKDSLVNKIKESGFVMRVEVEEDLEWEESVVEGYTECPVLTQTYRVFLGDEQVFVGDRMYGSEMSYSAHARVDGYWEAIRIDDGGVSGAIEALEDLGFPIETPNVPKWKK